ncbi:MAG: hypothetical protein KKE24_00015 [Candidatus Thermoplasmatota archaeon]|nr:hypothetical protein [Candidatus Thermoplasmatota archaeon]
MPAQISKSEVLSIMEKIGNICSMRIQVYLVGGGAMALRGEKDATKDLDLIVRSSLEAQELKRAFESLGFDVNTRHPQECHALVDATILSASGGGVRADIFAERICNKLRLSEGMIRRAERVDEWGELVLYICSREDIFLLKSVTERSRDLDDMIALFRKGLSRDIILEECDNQTDPEGLRKSSIWEAFLLTKLDEMERRYGVKVPWKRALKTRAELKMGAQRLLTLIDKGMNSVDGLSTELRETPAFIRECLDYLEKNNQIVVDRKVRPHRIKSPKRAYNAADNRTM